MTVEEIIDYIKSLKKGFDSELFEFKVKALAYIVDTSGLEPEEFHTLFKVWLNLSIPVTKWENVGVCLVPREIVSHRTVEYALQWILANLYKKTFASRLCFLLDWLTVAMDHNHIDMVALDMGYEVFYKILTFEVLTAHALRLVYTLTKPTDVTRRRVLDLMRYAKITDNKKSIYHQVQVLLGLFKSYSPECVPENIPALAVHTSFKKVNDNLVARFKRSQDFINSLSEESHRLHWINPFNSIRGRNKKAEPLVPNMEFINVGLKQSGEEFNKKYLDFKDPVSLLQYSLHHSMCGSFRLRSLLCNDSGITLLVTATRADHTFLSHDLHYLLNNCYLKKSAHSYLEKQHLLRRIVVLERTLLTGIPVVTKFLAQYLPLWNEKDYFAEILELVEWVNIDCADHIMYILDTLARIYYRSQPIQQCAILRSIVNMYTNLVFSSSRHSEYFTSANSSEINTTQFLKVISAFISDMCNKGLQISPDDMRVMWASARAAETQCRAELRGGAALGSLPALLTLLLPFTHSSAALIDKMPALLLLYKKTFTAMKSANIYQKDHYTEHLQILNGFSSDIFRCLFNDEAFTGRSSGFVFQNLDPMFVSVLNKSVPNVDAVFSLSKHIAFAPHTYLQFETMNGYEADNKTWFETVIDEEFTNISTFLRKAEKKDYK